MRGSPCGGYEFFGPCDRLVLFDSCTKERRENGDRHSGVEILVVGRPPERYAQVRQLECEPLVRFALTRAIPQRKQSVSRPAKY